jgi:hypothetical protein
MITTQIGGQRAARLVDLLVSFVAGGDQKIVKQIINTKQYVT